jgi:hypothetical protein
MFGIKIDGEFLDNPIDGEVTFELNYGGFTDTLIPGSITYPNNFPASDKNNRLLKNGKVIDAASKTVYYDAELYLFDNFYDKCKVVRLNTRKDLYRLSVVINNLTIDVKGKTLRDIDCSSENRTFPKISMLIDFMNWCNAQGNEHLFVFPRIQNTFAFEDIAESAPYLKNFYDGIINRYVDGPVIVPYVFFGDYESAFKRYFFAPKIREVKLLELLFAQYGYRVSGSFINDQEARSLSMYSNRLIKADRRELIQVGCKSYSDAKSTGTFYNWPSLSIDSDPTNQDYNGTLDVWVNNYEFLNIYEDELPKIKINSALNYDVGIKGTINAATENVTMTILVIEPATPSDVGGDVLNQFTFNIDVAPDEDLDYIFHQQFNFGAALGPTPPSEVIIAVGFRTNVDDADFSISNFVVSIAPFDIPEQDAEIEPIDCAQFLPNKSIEEWLLGLKTNFNLNIQWNPFSRTVTIDYLDDALKKPIEIIDHRIGDDFPLKTPEEINGYTISYDFDSLTDQLLDENFKDLDTAQFKGFEQPTEKAAGAYYFDLSNGQVRKFGYNSIRWSFYSDAYYPLIIGGGEKEISISGRAPIFMRADSDNITFQASVKTPMHFPRFGMSADSFSDVRIGYYRGYTPSSDGSLLLPTSTPLSIAADGVTEIGLSELWFIKDRKNSIYNLYFRRWLSMIKNAEQLRDVIMIDMPFIQSIFDTQKQIQNTIFIVGKLIFTVKNGAIKEAEIELYRNNFEHEQID